MLADKLKEARTISQEKVGELIGVPRVTIAGWEGGRTTPRPKYFKAISEVYGIPLEELLPYMSKNMTLSVNGKCVQCGEKLDAPYCMWCGRRNAEWER